MIEKFIKGKVYVFIDASNIYHSFKKLGWKIDFTKLKEYFKKNTDLGNIYPPSQKTTCMHVDECGERVASGDVTGWASYNSWSGG